ncbi:hypothetical protein D9V41_03665 [Aeromicrobium phragmitis]|uniref:Uncharacterized protein n=1 Tax=Aeromicrobium phragmitis TaxID=2478914 RepID=A0A3L8PNJ2_9ACTN|nr:hypothetical protein [Aeromicrobium phragmitis]RLV56880.1 hypothetical protein D9V41_03665 [Aeromicrobium phragmitis]
MLKRLLQGASLIALIGGFLMVSAASASAECAEYGYVQTPDGLVYTCIVHEPGTGGPGGGNGGGGPAPTPTCTFEGIWNQFCRGEKACYMFDPAHLQNPEAAGVGPKPEDANHLVYISCKAPGQEREDQYLWDSELDEEQGPSLADRVFAAHGLLQLPGVDVNFNPPTRTLVNLDTWWWAEGLPAGEIVGPPAYGLRAIATPETMTVETGDGSRLECRLVTSRSDECRSAYRRAGDYTATMTVEYSVRFEDGGNLVDVPDALSGLLTASASGTATVPVREVQSLVTDLG